MIELGTELSQGLDSLRRSFTVDPQLLGRC